MKKPVHPGKILGADVIEALGLTVGQAADRLGVSRVTLSRIINGHSGISPNLAVRLENAGVSTARMWLAMQSNFDLAAEREKNDPKVTPLRHETATGLPGAGRAKTSA
jgi:antitoxin HigA-1